jgi:hypothetical protein
MQERHRRKAGALSCFLHVDFNRVQNIKKNKPWQQQLIQPELILLQAKTNLNIQTFWKFN